MSYHHLSTVEQYQIAALQQAGQSNKAIALILQRHPSTIGRELARNATQQAAATYCADAAVLCTAARRAISSQNSRTIEANT